MRFFRTSADALYEESRLSLDAALGYPTADGQTVTCIDPAAAAPRDSQGRILLAVRPEFLACAPVAAVLPDLLSSGNVEEITAADYMPV